MWTGCKNEFLTCSSPMQTIKAVVSVARCPLHYDELLHPILVICTPCFGMAKKNMILECPSKSGLGDSLPYPSGSGTLHRGDSGGVGHTWVEQYAEAPRSYIFSGSTDAISQKKRSIDCIFYQV